MCSNVARRPPVFTNCRRALFETAIMTPPWLHDMLLMTRGLESESVWKWSFRGGPWQLIHQARVTTGVHDTLIAKLVTWCSNELLRVRRDIEVRHSNVITSGLLIINWLTALRHISNITVSAWHQKRQAPAMLLSFPIETAKQSVEKNVVMSSANQFPPCLRVSK